MFDVEKIRADFPLLSTEVYGRPLVYLDSGATAQKPRCVIDTVDYLHRELNANIHRGVHRLAEEATERYEAARDRIRAFIGAAHREEVIFTAGATASLNTVANRIIEITPNGMIDKYMEYDDYLFDERVQENLSKLYSKKS